MKRLVLVSLAAGLLAACGGSGQIIGSADGGPHADGGALDAGDAGQPDGGGDGGVIGTLTGLDPATGPLAGGTAVEVRGTGFVAGLGVTLGGDACTGLVVISDTRVSCNTPAHATAEAVDVTATWPGGATATLTGAFTYQSAPPASVDYAQLFDPATDPTVTSGSTVTVSAQVYVAGVTPGAGQGAGVTAQVGFGPATANPSADPSTFTFAALAYTGDADGLNPGDQANDVYGGDVAVPAQAGSYRLAVRFSLDGTTWTYADRTGTADGFAATDLPTVTVQPPAQPGIGYAKLLQPAADATVAGGDMVTVSAEVYVAGVTPGPGQGGGVHAQVGFGPATADPKANPSAFTFTDLQYTGDSDGLNPGDQANDVYGGSIAAPAADGSYRLAVRFTLDAATYTYADLTGTADGFTATDLPTITVSNTTTVAIDYCELHYPATLLGAPGQRTDLVYGWVYTAGVTDQSGQAAGIEAQVGVGATGTDPATDASWTFANAQYNTDTNNGANDEYMAAITAPTAPGGYDYAYRFSGDGGQTWTYCDLASQNGSTDGYQPAGAGKLTVITPTVDYCELHYPATLSGTVNQSTGLTVYGWVYKAGVTDTGSQGPYIEAEVGVGGHGSDPTASSSGWTWYSAAYHGKAPGSANNDEYMGDLTAPGTAGTYDYAYRFRIQGGSTWTYCDLPGANGAPGGSTNGYSPADAGVLTVQ